MRPLSVEDFRTAVEARIAQRRQAEAGSALARVVLNRNWLETRPEVASEMIIIARMSVGLTGFPSALRKANYDYSSFAKDIDNRGFWRLVPDAKGIEDLRQTKPSAVSSRSVAADYCLPSLGMASSSEAIDILTEIAEWPADPRGIWSQLTEISPLLPRHVLATSLAYGSQVMETIGIARTPENTMAWIRGCAKAGVDLNGRLQGAMQTDYTNWPPLHYLAESGDTLFLIGMLLAGANKDQPCEFGSTPIMRTAIKLQIPAYTLLRQAGADALATDNDDNNALHYLAGTGIEGDLNVIEHIAIDLINAGIDPAARNADGETPAELFGKIGFNDTEKAVRVEPIIRILNGQARSHEI